MRRCQVNLLLSGLILLLCGRAPSAGAIDIATSATMDWIDADGQLPRGLLFANNKWFGDFDTDLAGRYLRDGGFDAPWDSLGAAEFAARADAEREWRRREAVALVRKAFIAVNDRASRMSNDILAGRQSIGPLYLIDRVMLRTLSYLRTAVGTDPGNAAAWYHLAYFSDVVGDRESAGAACERFLDLAEPPDPRRVRLILDEAWRLRDAGRYAAATLWLDGNRTEFSPTPASKHQIDTATEAELIRALCCAEQGDRNGARLHLTHLPKIRLRDQYGWRDSDILRTWVNAWAQLRSGEPELAAFHLRYRPGVRLPAGIAWRCWQDLGLISEDLDAIDSAATYWGLAYLSRPFIGFYPLIALHGTSSVLGQPDTGEPYFVTFRRFFTGGSMWGFAATRALLCQREDELDNPRLWRQTFASLGACIRRGIHEPQARLLRARLNLQRGDWRAADADLRNAAMARITGTRSEADVAFLRGVALLNSNRLAESLAPLRLCVELDPHHARGWQALAVVESYLDHDDAALAAYDRVEQLEPRDGVNYFNRGLLNLHHGRRDAAETDLVQAAQLLDDNAQAIELLQAIASGRDVTVDLAPQPVKLVASDEELSVANRLDRLLNTEDLNPEFQDMIAESPEEHARWLEMFERRYRDEPAAEHRARLAEARADAGDQRGVVELLEPDWPEGLAPRERILLLDADRALGLVDRAAAIARDEVPARVLDVPLLVRATVLLLDHGRPEDARAVFARAVALAPDEPALRELAARLP